MDNSVKEFINYILTTPDARVDQCGRDDKAGLIVRSNELGLSLSAFSDSYGGYYFECKLDVDFSSRNTNSGPTYRTEDSKEIDPILYKMIEIYEKQENKYESNAIEYLSIFKDLLKGNSCHKDFSLKKDSEKVRLYKDDRCLATIDLFYIRHVRNSFTKQCLEPTTVMELPVTIVSSNGRAVFLMMNKFLNDYSLLWGNNHLKNQGALVDSPEDWFKKIKETKYSKKEFIFKAIDNIQLNNKLKEELISDDSEKHVARRPKV